MFPAWEIILTGVAAGLFSAGAVWLLPFARKHRWHPLAGVAVLVGWLVWNFSLSAAGASGFASAAPLLRVRGQDAGSGAAACLFTVLALGLLQPKAPAGQVVLTGVVAGAAAIFWNVFVL